MTPKTEFGTVTGLSVYGILGYASSYLEPVLQFALLIAVLIGAVLLAYGRYLDIRLKRLKIQNYEEEKE
ncbi:hypothetical protein PsAD2_03044 [Pseudovibrio axinellae]|uniref:Uncharacterized protein n=1 Tax=Pseudovibrio axinellae TaxID=989403 RepID=A0A165XHL4_9HYPH|nr:hypothetical protein [Pseudovibrio axinellae]KZL17707.1 hypothetical protein PsAD2_03044 [Pseudovibrio axinellae]SER42850.1 hypothetical protein SAMN05421798_11037 [Pseudovibrio axinellae]